MVKTSIFDIIGYSSSSIIFILGALLASVSVPKKEQWQEFRKMKISLTAAYFILSILGVVDHIIEPASGENYLSQVEISSVLFISAFQALLFTATNLVFVRSSYVNQRNIVVNAVVILIIGAALFLSIGNVWFEYMRYAACALYFGQLIFFTTLFDRELKICIRRLEQCYDDDMQDRLNWIRNCYYSALAIGIIALLCVTLPINKLYYNIFVIVYTMYYAYILGKVYHYRLGAKFIVELPPTEESAQDCEPIIETTNCQYTDLERKLDKWVENKHYLKRDIAIGKIVEEMGVSRRFLSAYFTSQHQTTFRRWRMDLRLQEAARILKEEENVKIGRIYERIGFTSEANFYREFRLKFGTTPSDYTTKL